MSPERIEVQHSQGIPGNVGDKRRLYEKIVSSHARDIYRFAFRLCGSADRAEDLVQEAMYHAWRSIDSLRDADRARFWLLGILRNRYKHALRKQGRRIQTVSDDVSLDQVSDHVGEKAIEQLENQELLQHALNTLDDRYKEPFLLVHMQGLACRDAAELLQLPLGTVLSRIHRAKQHLRRQIQQTDSREKSSRDGDGVDDRKGNHLQHIPQNPGMTNE